MNLDAPFSGAHALLFGAGKGIGRAVAEEFARRGARVSIADIDIAAAREAVELIGQESGSAKAYSCDVLRDESIDRTIADAEAVFGPVDIVMNNVGAILNGHPEDIPFEEWQRISDLNYGATWRCVKMILPGMLERGRGHIVNTASFAGTYPYAASRMPYAAAKAAIINLSENLALYCEPLGLRVTCLIPGPVVTTIAESMTNWTPNAQLRGPGANLASLQPAVVATRLADGMRDGRVLVSSDDALWEIVKQWAADPDAFIREKIAEVAAGNLGLPQR